MSEITEKLVYIQSRLKAPKDQKASRYRYRNVEDINEAVKPLAAEVGCAVIYTDTIEDGLLTATCVLMAEKGSVSVDACAYVNTSPKGMSIEQACGAASSYARKYAACGLFAIDSSELDPDAAEEHEGRSYAEELKAARSRAWSIVQRWAELNGEPPAMVMSKEKEVEGYENTPEFWNGVATRYEEELENVSE